MSQRSATRTPFHKTLRAIIGIVAVMLVAALTMIAVQFSPRLPVTPLVTDRQETVTPEDGGDLPKGVTVFDETYSGVANLDPALAWALRRAATDARNTRGIELYINSGWRSRRYQDQLLREAVAEYGTLEEASRWVATSDTSAHVSGNAVDIGGAGATEWLSEHGSAYGLCQIYLNEPWHYELRSGAPAFGCPGMYADPTQDPRMQR